MRRGVSNLETFSKVDEISQPHVCPENKMWVGVGLQRNLTLFEETNVMKEIHVSTIYFIYYKLSIVHCFKDSVGPYF